MKGNQGTSRAPNKNKQPCSCQTFLRNLPFHLVQCISLHLKSPDLYLFCKKKVFPKFLLPFESQESFSSEEFAYYDYAPRSLSLLVACRRMLMQKRPPFDASRSSCTERFCTSRIDSLLKLTPLYTFVSKKVISVFEISDVNFIVELKYSCLFPKARLYLILIQLNSL